MVLFSLLYLHPPRNGTHHVITEDNDAVALDGIHIAIDLFGSLRSTVGNLGRKT